MILKIHVNADKRTVVCVTDEELIGKTFEEGNKQLDLSSAFFKGEQATEEEVKQALQKASMLMINGPKSIAFVQNQGIDISKILEISGVPFAQIVLS